MSDDAVRDAETYTHPDVTRSGLALLRAIAEAIPEGQTTTPLIGIPELASKARQHERTARTNRDLLEEIGKVKVHEGGQGKVARYEILNIEGARPATAVPLPLRADLREARRTKGQRKTPGETPGLFDATPGVTPEIRVYTVGRFTRSWRSLLTNIGCFARSWFQTPGVSPGVALPLDVPITDSGIAATTKYPDLDPDPDQNLVAVADARAREPADTFLDWFEQTYPTFHQGAVCSVLRARDRALVSELLRRPLTDVAHLQAMTRYLWEVTTDGVEGSNRWWIAERVTVRDVVVLHRKANFLDLEVRRAQQEAAATRDVWLQVLQWIEARVNRHTFHTWFKDTVLVHDDGDVIQVAGPGVNGDIHCAWIQKHYGDLVRTAVEETRPGARVDFVAADMKRRQFG